MKTLFLVVMAALNLASAFIQLSRAVDSEAYASGGFFIGVFNLVAALALMRALFASNVTLN